MSQSTITSRFKSLVKFIHTIASSPLSRKSTSLLSSVQKDTNTDSCTPTAVGFQRESEEYLQADLCATEVYLPSHMWYPLDTSESSRFTCLADLCVHIGNQLPVQVVKLVARDVLRSLHRFHHANENMVYQDINPTNILLSSTDLCSLICQLRAETQLSLISSQLCVRVPFYQQKPNTEMKSGDAPGHGYPPFPDTEAVFKLSKKLGAARCNRLEYDVVDHEALQPPEVLLGAPCDTAADMWTLGCVVRPLITSSDDIGPRLHLTVQLFELLTGEALFDPIFQTGEPGVSKEETHLIQMIELFGEIPKDLIRAGQLSGEWFTDDGSLRIDTTYYPVSLGTVLERHIEKAEVEGATDFLEALLALRPDQRAHPLEMIDHPWFSS